jgi:hypothetical protein
MNNVQKFSLVIIGIFTVLLNVLIITYPIGRDSYWLSILCLVLVNFGALLTLIAHHIRCKWTFKFDWIPLFGIGIVFENGRLGLMLPFCAITYGRKRY